MAERKVIPTAPAETDNQTRVEMAHLMNANGVVTGSSVTIDSKSKYRGLRYRIYGLYGIVAILTITCLITFGILFHKQLILDHIYANLPVSDSKGQFCLPCDSLKQTYLKLKKIQVTESNDGLCCVDINKNFKLLNAFVKKITHDERHLVKAPVTLRGAERSTIVAADLYHYDPKSTGRTSEVIDQWVSDVGRAFTKGGVEVRDGTEVVVPEDGYYRVYCKVQFTLSERNVSERLKSDDFIRLTIVREDVIHNNEESLRESLITRSVTNIHEKDPQHSTLSDEGVFYLKKNDRLFVKLSQSVQLSSDSKSTYFGIHKL